MWLVKTTADPFWNHSNDDLNTYEEKIALSHGGINSKIVIATCYL